VQVTKRDGTDPVRVNQVFSYFIVVRNNGPGTATSVGVQDNLPAGMTAGFSSAPCSLGSTVICSLGNLANGAIVTIELRVIASQLGTFTNNVGAFGSQPDPNTSNNTDSESTTVVSTLRTPTAPAVSTSFSSTLELEASAAQPVGRVLLNDTVLGDTRNRAPYVHHFTVAGQEARVEGHLESAAADSEGFWLFDFTDSPNFTAGSLRAESGIVVSLTSHKIVFSLKNGATPIRFRARFDDPEPHRLR
jgi:uncharacterized repeat protein (TIGR01451 family)